VLHSFVVSCWWLCVLCWFCTFCAGVVLLFVSCVTFKLCLGCLAGWLCWGRVVCCVCLLCFMFSLLWVLSVGCVVRVALLLILSVSCLGGVYCCLG